MFLAIVSLALVTSQDAAGQAMPVPDRADALACSKRLAKIKDDLDSRRIGEIRLALAKGLKPEALAACRDILASDPQNKTAAQLVLVSQNPIRASAARPTEAKAAALQAARQGMAERIEAARQEAVAQYLALAQWCGEKNLPAEKAQCFTKTIALDPGNEQAHLGLGDKIVPPFGWVSEEVRRKWADGLWFTDGQWSRWEDVSRARIAAMKARVSAHLGEDFRYTTTHHLTVVSNLKDATFEKDLIEGLQLCVADQRSRLYEPYEPGGDKPFCVMAFENQSEFREYCRKIRSSAGDSMGFYAPAQRTLHVWRTCPEYNNGIGTSFHELTHGTLEDYLGRAGLPEWLDEGVASFHEKARQKEDRMNFGPINIPRMRALRELLAAGKTVTAQELIAMDAAAWQKSGMIGYNASAMFMHYLWDRNALQPFLRHYRTSRDARAALEAVLKQDLESTNRQYQAFMHEKILDPDAIAKMLKQMEGTRRIQG